MHLKLTLSRPSGDSDDIVVTTDAAASISDVAGTISRLDPRRAPTASLESRGLTLRAILPGHEESLLLPPDATVGEAWIGSGATVELANAGVYYSPPRIGSAPTVATLRVDSGPDAGREFYLAAGTTILGRGADCDVVLTDPLVSKRHVRFEISTNVEAVDLGSANGLVVDGALVERARFETSETMLVGDSQITITVAGSVAEAGVVQKAGPVHFNRSPRVEARYGGQEFAAPRVPEEKEEQPFPFIALLAPVMLGLAIFFLTQRPTSLLFVLMAPMMIVGNFLTTKSRAKRRLAKQIRQFDLHLESLSAQLANERITERETRLRESPSTADAFDQAMRRGPMLWTRRPEHWSFLNVRLGIGSMRSRNTVDSSSKGEMLIEFRDRLEELIDEHARVDGVPVIDNLFDSGALGVAGTPASATGSMNSLLVQLTAMHSPSELVVASLVTPQWSRALSWLKWMPHTSSPHSPLEGSHLADSASSASMVLSALEEIVAMRLRAKKSNRRGAMNEDRAAIVRGADVGERGTVEGTQSQVPAIVVLISDDVSVDRARLVQLAEQGADAGVFPIWVAPDVVALPAVCRTYLELTDQPGRANVGFVRLGDYIENVAIESIDPEAAMRYARRMAPVIDAGALVADSSDLPRSVSLVSLLGHELTEASDAVIDRWRQNSSIHDRTSGSVPKPKRAGKLRAMVGSGGVNAMHLDLRTQGPHALVGGTTGAGKSEFLQAWVLGMAAEYSPDRVSFLFVDYKGGSAFADCVTLPHCVGLVTDLSPHLVRRALTSLRAELHHREHLLNRKKAKDLLELEKRGDPESPPALVLVIDEFAALVGEVPEFVDGVVDIAQRGRSLGIHLIMATQRPAGVIKDNLRANTNLRVALRMADESDSNDVVGIKEAAHFDPAVPGRAIAKTGPGRLQQFQSGYAGGWTAREPERPGIDVAELRFGSETPWEDRSGSAVDEVRDLGPTDQQRLVSSIIDASIAAGIPEPRRPWLDELPDTFDTGALRQRTDRELIIGVSDVPQNQEQHAIYFRPDVDGHIAVYGTGGSGKSAALRTLACAAGVTPRGGPVAVYGLDFGAGSLRMLEALPHVGSIIAAADTERIIRLFRMLRAELEDRGRRFSEADASNIVTYRELAMRPDEPRILLLVDGFPAFRAEWEVTSGRSLWYDVFKDVLSDGRQLGIHVAFTADRAGAVPSSIGSSVQRRIVLRLADETGYRMLDSAPDILTSNSPPGRAIVDGLETQIAVPGGATSVSDQSAAVKVLAASLRGSGTVEVAPVGALPKEYDPTTLPATIDRRPVIGLGDESLGPIGFDPAGTMLLSGPPASGRSNALIFFARSLDRFDPAVRRYYIGNPRSGLVGRPGWAGTATSVDEASVLAKDLSAAVSDSDTEGRIAVFIETLGDFLQTPADAPIVELIKAIKRSDHFLVAEGETASWNSSWPIIAEIKNARRGLLLQPDTIEGDVLLKTPLPRLNRAEFPAGRGMLIARGKANRVQLPLVGD